MLLKIKPTTMDIKTLYANHGTYHKGDSGIDLFVPEDIIIKSNSIGQAIDMKISCEALKKDITKYLECIEVTLKTELSDDSRELMNSINLTSQPVRI